MRGISLAFEIRPIRDPVIVTVAGISWGTKRFTLLPSYEPLAEPRYHPGRVGRWIYESVPDGVIQTSSRIMGSGITTVYVLWSGRYFATTKDEKRARLWLSLIDELKAGNWSGAPWQLRADWLHELQPELTTEEREGIARLTE